MTRLFLFVVALMTGISAAMLASGCLDAMPELTPIPDGSVLDPDHQNPAFNMASARLSEPEATPDAGEPSADLLPTPPPDLAPSDLAGLVNCYDSAYCDVATMFCLRFFGGSPGKPQPEKVAPSCYAPNDPCPNNTFDCACIQQDATLGPACAECFDNKDGTFTCYAE